MTGGAVTGDAVTGDAVTGDAPEAPEEAWLLRRVVAVDREGHDLLLRVHAVRALRLPGVPGWLTGEPPADQGLETALPNLPDLPLPPATQRSVVLRIQVAAADTVRLLVAPVPAEDPRPDRHDPRWLGIVTDGRPDPTAAARAHVVDLGDQVTLTTDRLRVVVARHPFALTVTRTDGRVLLRTAGRRRQAAGLPVAPALLVGDGTGHSDRVGPGEVAGARAETTPEVTLHVELGAGEEVAGFGEQFGRLVANGRRLRLRVADALGTGTGLAYKPVPVWHCSSGWTGLLNTGATVVADVEHSLPSVLGLTVRDTALDLYVVAGDDPRDRLASYTLLTGRAPRPPLWAFGYWQGRCRYHSAREMLDVARTMRRHALPCDVLHLDPDWLRVDRLSTDFDWNTDRFGDRSRFVADLAALGVRLSVWELPYLDPASPLHETAAAEGHLVRTVTGDLARVVGTPSPDGRPRALVDLSRPATRRWWQDLHGPFFADGVAVFKTDFGEGLPDGAVLGDGTPPNHAHNLYPLRYNAAVAEGTARHTGGPPIVWGRSGWAGSQRHPGQWGGDAESSVAGMRATVRGGLSYALSAPGFWSHDVGGFFGPGLTPALYVRWLQLGALSPLMRSHGLRPREPWQFGDRALALARLWLRRRYQLLPYLWQAATETSARGLPMMRPLGLHWPDDPVARAVDDQFLLGGDLLVAPVFDDGEEPVRRRLYVPPGRWVDLWTGQVLDGPGPREVDAPLEHLPVLARDGAVIPLVDVDDGDGDGDAGVRCSDDLVGRPWRLHVPGQRPPPGTVTALTGFDGAPVEVRWRAYGVGVTGGQRVHEAPVGTEPPRRRESGP